MKKYLSFFEPSLILLLFSNVLTIFLAVSQNWSVLTLMWIYLVQSLIIGFFTVVKIRTHKNFRAGKLKLEGFKITNANQEKYYVSNFFIGHYGFFHLVYAIFLISFSSPDFFTGISPQINFSAILIGSTIFLVDHLFSFIYNFKIESTKPKDIGKMMFFPYARIIPMHLTIIFGSMIIESKSALVFFLVLKTVADLIMHYIEHTKRDITKDYFDTLVKIENAHKNDPNYHETKIKFSKTFSHNSKIK